MSDNINELQKRHNLSLWSKVQSYETIFIIDVNRLFKRTDSGERRVLIQT